MTTATVYRIGDVARLSGFSAATLRFYDDQGLLGPVGRTAAGYRTFDDHTLERLAFITRAKQLGCSLDETAELLTAWDGGECGPVQDRLRSLVADKMVAARQRSSELAELLADLNKAAAALELHRPTGPCDDQCGCVSASGGDAAPAAPTAVALTRKAASAAPPPIACTLDAAALPQRLSEWRAALHGARRVTATDTEVALRLPARTDPAALAALCMAEMACCRFFTFTITLDHDGVQLRVGAPTGAGELVESLLGGAS